MDLKTFFDIVEKDEKVYKVVVDSEDFYYEWTPRSSMIIQKQMPKNCQFYQENTKTYSVKGGDER